MDTPLAFFVVGQAKDFYLKSQPFDTIGNGMRGSIVVFRITIKRFLLAKYQVPEYEWANPIEDQLTACHA